MSAPRPVLDDVVRAALDEIPHPLSIATAVRDSNGVLVDFRIDLVNAVVADRVGEPRTAIVGRLAGEVLPAMHDHGLFDALCDVVETGRPLRRTAMRFEGVVDGHPVGGVLDLSAVRLADGYIVAWQAAADGDAGSDALWQSLLRAQASIRLVRLESTARTALRPELAT